MSAAEYDDQQPATLWAETGDDRVGDGGAVPAHTDQTATAGATAARDEADAAALAEAAGNSAVQHLSPAFPDRAAWGPRRSSVPGRSRR